jgi:glycogen(starch) synthase
LKVIGEGPCRNDLEERVRKLGLADQVEFLGAIVGEPLVNILNRHKILVVPSSWNEPFGIVALEGIACGCMVIGSSGGGLPEAIGPCGDYVLLTATVANLPMQLNPCCRIQNC